MLYQVATAALNPSDIASPIRSVLRRQKNTEVLLGEACEVDVPNRKVLLTDGGTLGYDYLLVGTGARHSYFGHDEWEALAPGLKNLEDALEIRRRVLLAFELAERETDPVRRHAYLTFVVVGGGPTGVEMAGAVAEIRRYALRRDFRHIDPGEATVMLLEGGPRLLAAYPPKLSDKAKLDLRRLGVEVRTETMVTDIQPGWVRAAGWTIPTQTVIWAAGNTASPLLQLARRAARPDGAGHGGARLHHPGPSRGLRARRRRRLRTPGGRHAPGHLPHGDPDGAVRRAQVIAGDLAGRPRRAFRYWDKGQLAVIGRGRAVADIWKLHFGGFIAWLAWIFVHIFFLIGFRNRVLVLIQWAWSYFTYGRGARLITEEFHPQPPGQSRAPAPARGGARGGPMSLAAAGQAQGRGARLSRLRHHRSESDSRWRPARSLAGRRVRRRHALPPPPGQEAEGSPTHRARGQVCSSSPGQLLRWRPGPRPAAPGRPLRAEAKTTIELPASGWSRWPSCLRGHGAAGRPYLRRLRVRSPSEPWRSAPDWAGSGRTPC